MDPHSYAKAKACCQLTYCHAFFFYSIVKIDKDKQLVILDEEHEVCYLSFLIMIWCILFSVDV